MVRKVIDELKDLIEGKTIDYVESSSQLNPPSNSKSVALFGADDLDTRKYTGMLMLKLSDGTKLFLWATESGGIDIIE